MTVTNHGNIDARDTLSVTFGLSADGGATLAVPFTPVVRRAVVRVGRAVSVRLRVRTPATVPVGTYTPVVTVTSGSQIVTAVGTTPVTFG